MPFLTGRGRAGLFIAKDLVKSVGESVIRDDIVGVIVGNTGFVSAYLPDSGKSDDLFSGAVADLIDLSKALVRKGASSLCLMGDF